MPNKKTKPYVSDKQRKWAHTEEGKEALGEADVKRKDKATKGKSLPEKSTKSSKKKG